MVKNPTAEEQDVDKKNGQPVAPAKQEKVSVRPFYTMRHDVSGWYSAESDDLEQIFVAGGRSFWAVWGLFLGPLLLFSVAMAFVRIGVSKFDWRRDRL